MRSENLTASQPDSVDGTSALLARVIGRDAAGRVMRFSTCLRCSRPCAPETVCRVRHPVCMRAPGPGWPVFKCVACNADYTPPTFVDGRRVEAEESDADYCFVGEHTLCPLRERDDRRSVKPRTEIFESELTQEEIDELPDYVQMLTITAEPPYSAKEYKLARHFPELESLCVRSRHSDGLELDVVLNDELTPKLEYLFLSTGDLRGEISLSNLVTIKVDDFEIGACIDGLLSAATKLAVCHIKNGLRNVTELHVASYVLESLDICGASQLAEITIWAPNLNLLGLEHCNSIERISFGRSNELEAFLPPSYIPPTLRIYLTSEIADTARDALAAHPKGVFVAESGYAL